MNEIEPNHFYGSNDQDLTYEFNSDDSVRAIADAAIKSAEYETWSSRRLLFVTGPHASGKSAIVHASFSTPENNIHDLGPIIRENHRKADTALSLGKWIIENEAIFSTSFTDELLVNEIRPSYNEAPPKGLILIGSRSLNGIEYILQAIEPSDHKIVYVDADYETLFQRYKNREILEDLNYEKFNKILDEEVGMGLHEIKEYAHHSILNNSSLEHAKNKIIDIFNEWQQVD
ncbi:MAG: hypothetical protein NTV95_01215 [Candidatus Saccharibacteria bacterium]|nr:hypothetical protein [Candidatus Saccharibacteria bacterium]